MNIRLAHQSYGKSRVRFTKVTRHAPHHDIAECTVYLQLEGEFEKSYVTGDNSQIVPTDTIKNTVYAVAQQNSWVDIETFGQQLTSHFLNSFSHVSMASASIEQVCWQRAIINSKPHEHSFVRGPEEVAKCVVQQDRESTYVESGISGLQILKTTESSFVGYIVDQFTTLAPAKDRIFATNVDATWSWSTKPIDCDEVRRKVRDIILQMFATEHSPSVQYTIYRIGGKILESFPEILDVTLSMPNQHRLLVDVDRLGLTGDHSIFCPTDEPYGDITATIERE